MKTLHINSNYLTSKLHENLIDRLERNNINNTIFMPIKKETVGAFLYESKHDVHSPITFKDIDKYVFTYKQSKIFKKLLQTVDPSEYDVVHAHTLFTDGNVAYKLYKKFNIPYVVTVRGYTDIYNFFKLRINLRNLGRKILKHASKIIFLSGTNRQELLDKYIHNDDLKRNIIDKSFIIPNGIDDFWFENEGTPKKLEETNKLKVIFVGRKIEVKNLLGTVKALNYLKNTQDMDITYTAIGPSNDESYMEKVRKEAEIEYRELPAISKEELIGYYRASDIFVMPSYSETFGLVYPEAMSQGLPVIYTKGQGFDGQFEEGSVGYAVDSTNHEDIANKILMIQNNYEELSINSLQKYKKFNWDNISQEFMNVYKSVK